MRLDLIYQLAQLIHGTVHFFQKLACFLQKIHLNAHVNWSNCLHLIDGLCQYSCILDNCRNDLLGCHVHHGFRFDVNCFRINLILDLRSGLQLSLCKYSKFSEQFYSLICSKCRNGIYHRWQNRKSAAACLFFPFRSIAIAVKYDSLMLGSIFLDQIMDCQIKVFCALQNIAGFLKRLSSNGIQHHIACGNGILGTNHTELEFIAGKGKG